MLHVSPSVWQVSYKSLRQSLRQYGRYATRLSINMAVKLPTGTRLIRQSYRYATRLDTSDLAVRQALTSNSEVQQPVYVSHAHLTFHSVFARAGCQGDAAGIIKYLMHILPSTLCSPGPVAKETQPV